ncbi:MAG: hypothetical protein ACRC2H_11155 [Silanimonas sp.]
MFLRPIVLFAALFSGLTACASAPRSAPQAATSPPNGPDARIESSTSPSHAERATAPPPLSAFEGTWQYGEPCKGIYHWMQLRLDGLRLQGRWAAYSENWGFDSGAIRASPAPAYPEDNQWGFTRAQIATIRREGFLELETCQDVSDLPRYAESRCPEVESWPREWLKLDTKLDPKTSELMFVAPNFMSYVRMKRVEESSAPPPSCPASAPGETP